MQQIKELAEKYSYEELEKCIDQHIKEGTNSCYVGEDNETTVNKLSKASFIKQMIQKGECRDVTEGIRKLAASMRGLQSSDK